MDLNYLAIKESILSYKKECQEIRKEIIAENFKLVDYYKELNKLRKRYNFSEKAKNIKNINEKYRKKDLERIRAMMLFCLYSENFKGDKYYKITEFLSKNYIYVDVFPSEIKEFTKEIICCDWNNLQVFDAVVSLESEETGSAITIPLLILEDEKFLNNLSEMYKNE